MPGLDGLSRRSAIFVETEADATRSDEVKGHYLVGPVIHNDADRDAGVAEYHWGWGAHFVISLLRAKIEGPITHTPIECHAASPQE